MPKPVSAKLHPREGRARDLVHRLGSCGSMKMKLVMGSLVLGASLCTPSFGGGLLDRMLGMKGSGCDSACCDTGCSAAPSCGCEIAPTCDPCAPACKSGGLLSKLRSKKSCDCAAPSCGCEVAPSCDGGCGAAPSCGCEVAPSCSSGCGAAPSCGCEVAPSCSSGCGAAPSCGCEMASCDGGCGAAPSCGCEIASCDPCGCDSGCKPRRRPLMELIGKIESAKRSMFSKCKSKGCDACGTPTCGCEISACGGCGSTDPSCGCEVAPSCDGGCGAAPSCGCEIAACDPCAPSCGKKCGGLLSKLFKKKNSSCCDTVACCDSGCDSGCTSGCSSCGGSSAAPVAAPVVHGDAAPMPPAPIVDPSAYLQSNRRVIQATSYVR